MGQNCYGGFTYGYADYLKDKLSDKENIIYIDYYTRKNNNIELLHNDILQDKNIILDGNNYNIKRLLQESEIITMSIGLNDIIYEYNIKNKTTLSSYEEDNITNYIYNNFKELMKEIRKYTKKTIYILGYPERNTKYKSIISKLNKKYSHYKDEKNVIYIDTNEVLNKEEYFDNNYSIFPNTKGYRKIANEILENIPKKDK